jgi:hypothetical protein
MTLNRAYMVNSLYQYRASDSGHLLHASVVDSATKRIAAGLYYNFIHASPSRTLQGNTKLEETLKTHEVGLALAYPLAQLLHLGLTGKYVTIDIEQTLENDGTVPPEAKNEGDSGFTMDIGAVIKPLPALNLAVVYANVIPIENSQYNRQLGFGVAYALGTRFLAEFDTVLDFDKAEEVKVSYHGGAELFLGAFYGFRGGVMYDTFREATYVSGGFGIVAKKIALDFGLRQMVDGGAESMVAFSVRLFLQ